MRKPTQLMNRLFAMAACLWSMQAVAQAPTNMVTYADYGIETMNSHMMLSDSTWLVGGVMSDLSALPASVNVVTLDTAGFEVETFDATVKTAIIMHISKDMQTLVNVVAFPAGTVKDVYKIRTTNVPGQPTAMLYISGERNTDEPGYYISRLNNNFLNGVPTAISSYISTRSRNVDNGKNDFWPNASWYRRKQPWDVDSKGAVYYTTGRDFSTSWTQITVADSMGNDIVKPGFTRIVMSGSYNGSTTYLDTGNNVIRNIEIATFDTISIGDSTIAVFRNGSLRYNRKVEVVEWLSSAIVLKMSGTDARPYRSVNLADYNQLNSDGNGGTVRGKYPLDYLYSDPCDNFVTQDCNGLTGGPGFTGYSASNIFTARVGDITVDRTNDHMYFGFTDVTYNSKNLYVGNVGGFDYGPYDHNSFLVGLDDNGNLKWWNRMHEEDTSGTGFTANQFVNNLEIDYDNNQVVALNYAVGTSDFVFFNGDNVAANPNASGFLNDFNGTSASIEYSWIGKFTLDSGKFQRATYVAEYGLNGYNGTALTDPNLDGWANPALGTPTYASTNCEGLSVAANGDVCVTCTGTRPMTTRNAYQRMYKADRDAIQDSTAVRDHFVRVYNQDLDSIKYSSVLTGIWNGAVGLAVGKVEMVHATAYNDKAVVTGSHNGTAFGTGYPRIGDLPVANVPTWGDTTLSGKTGVFAALSYNCPTPQEPVALIGIDTIDINGGGTENYLIAANTSATGYTWITQGNITSSPSNNSLTVGAVSSPTTAFILAAPHNDCGIGTFRAKEVTIVNTTGLSSSTLVQNGFELYPNPNNGDFNLFIKGELSGNLTLTVFDVYGKTIQKKAVNKQQAALLVEMNINEAAAGLYFIQIQGEQGRAVKRFVKQ